MDFVATTRIAGNPNRNPRRLMMVASAGFVLTGVVNTFLGPILPVLATRWALADSGSGYFFTVQFIGSILGVGMSSILLPRRGFRFSIGLAYLLMAAGTSGLISTQWRYALLGTLAFGLGLGLVIPATNLLISSANQHRRASALSTLNFCWGLGAVVAPVALYLAARHNCVPTFVVLLSVLLLVLAVSLAFTPGAEILPNEKKYVVDRQRVLHWRFVAIVGGMFFLYVAIETSVGGWIATLARRAPSSSHGSWILAPSLFWGGLLAGRGIAPLLLAGMRERNVALTSLMIAGSGMCVLVLSSQWPWIAAAGLLAGCGLATIFPITIALLSRFGDAEKRIAGPMFALAGLGGAIMPWLVGVISTWSGSLQVGLILPLLATGALLWIHAIGNHGSQPVLEHQIEQAIIAPEMRQEDYGGS